MVWQYCSIPATVLLVVVVMNSSHEYHQEKSPLNWCSIIGWVVLIWILYPFPLQHLYPYPCLFFPQLFPPTQPIIIYSASPTYPTTLPASIPIHSQSHPHPHPSTLLSPASHPGNITGQLHSPLLLLVPATFSLTLANFKLHTCSSYSQSLDLTLTIHSLPEAPH